MNDNTRSQASSSVYTQMRFFEFLPFSKGTNLEQGMNFAWRISTQWKGKREHGNRNKCKEDNDKNKV
jgi:hypothetical protein